MSKTSMPEGMKGVMGWVLGVGVIAFIALIMVIIFGNLSGNVGFSTEALSATNETVTQAELIANSELDGGARVGATTFAITSVYNGTGGVSISSGNYTLTASTGALTNTTSEFTTENWLVSYTYVADEQGKVDSDNIISNYTRSATNTSSQFPTVGTIVGIAILLLILISLLIFAIRKMMGVMNTSGGSSRSSFEGSSRSYS
jgi:hypothetical protein